MTDTVKKRILIVDDVPQNITLLNEILRNEYSISAATTGDKALQIATTKNPPDLILLDIIMPGMDGYEILKKLRTKRRTKNIPVVFVTSKDEIYDKMRGYKLGVTDYITKPLDKTFVVDIVKKILR